MTMKRRSLLPLLACALAFWPASAPAASGAVAAEAPAKKAGQTLGPNLSYFRVHALPGDQAALAGTGSGTLVIDLRFAAADAENAATFFSWLKSRARVPAPVLVLMNSETSSALLALFREGRLPAGVVTLGNATPGLTPDVPMEVTLAADRAAYDAFENGATLEELVNPKIDKIRHDEAAMARERAAGAAAEADDSGSGPDTEEKPASASATPAAPARGSRPVVENRMSRRRRIYEGKAKVLFEGPEPGTLVQYFKDDASAFNNQKKGTITGKGVLNNRISEYLMTKLGEIGVPTHFVRRLNMREQLVREVEIIPLEVVIRNVVAGSLSKRFGMPEGTQLPRSIVEYYYKSDELNDPMVSEEHITAFGWATPQDIDEILAMSLRINDFLLGLFLGVGLRLVDFKLEFGRLYENEEMRLVLADEISPDNCRLWDTKTGEKLDKDRFRRDLGNVEEAYQEVARRLGILPEGGPRDMKGPATMQ